MAEVVGWLRRRWDDIKGNFEWQLLVWLFGGGVMTAVWSAVYKWVRHVPPDWLAIGCAFVVCVVVLMVVSIISVHLSDAAKAERERQRAVRAEFQQKVLGVWAAFGRSLLNPLPPPSPSASGKKKRRPKKLDGGG